MSELKIVFSIFIIMVMPGCIATTMHTYQAAGNRTICEGDGLGKIAVLPEVAWRQDQKEPEKRELMALEVIERSFQGIVCGSISKPGGIREFSSWSSKPESELLKQFAEEGIDTIIIIRIEELTPRLQITYSLPILWVGSNEADFRLRVLSVKTGAVLNDMRVKRLTGGPFNIRPAEWSRAEFEAALDKIIGDFR
jgi:hypothetical protein